MVTTTFTFQDVSILYDLSRGSDRTVLREDITVGGARVVDLLKPILAGAGGRFDLMVPKLSTLLTHVYDAVWAFELATPGTLASRDAADRVQEALLSPLWLDLTGQHLDMAAMDVMLWGAKIATDWEGALPKVPRYIHKAAHYYWAATSALRLRNVDVGLLLLEAGDLSDNITYARVGQASGATERPGAFMLRLDPNPNQMLGADVLALRKTIDGWLSRFTIESGVPAQDYLSLGDIDGYLLRDPSRRTSAKFTVAYLLWTSYLVDDPTLANFPRGGEFMNRRLAEQLLGFLTTTEELVRLAEDPTGTFRFYSRVVSRLASKDWGGPPEQVAFDILNKIEKGHKEDVESCLNFWDAPLPAYVPAGLPWYVRWVETGRFVRNQVAHHLDAPQPIGTKWKDLERVAWFSMFCAIWLLRRKAPGKGKPGPTALSIAPPPGGGLSTTTFVIAPSGVTLSGPVVTDPRHPGQ